MQSACALLRHPATDPERLSTLLDSITRLLAPAAAGGASADGSAPPPQAAATASSAKLEQLEVMLRSAAERLQDGLDAEQVEALLQEVLKRGELALEDTQRVHEQERPLAPWHHCCAVNVCEGINRHRRGEIRLFGILAAAQNCAEARFRRRDVMRCNTRLEEISCSSFCRSRLSVLDSVRIARSCVLGGSRSCCRIIQLPCIPAATCM